MSTSSDVNPGKEPYRAWEPKQSADRRANWEQALNTGRRYEEPSRWNGVDR
jgi:hypothetical protein